MVPSSLQTLLPNNRALDCCSAFGLWGQWRLVTDCQTFNHRSSLMIYATYLCFTAYYLCYCVSPVHGTGLLFRVNLWCNFSFVGCQHDNSIMSSSLYLFIVSSATESWLSSSKHNVGKRHSVEMASFHLDLTIVDWTYLLWPELWTASVRAIWLCVVYKRCFCTSTNPFPFHFGCVPLSLGGR